MKRQHTKNYSTNKFGWLGYSTAKNSLIIGAVESGIAHMGVEIYNLSTFKAGPTTLQSLSVVGATVLNTVTFNSTIMGANWTGNHASGIFKVSAASGKYGYLAMNDATLILGSVNDGVAHTNVVTNILGGNFGVGTLTPSEKVEVAGILKATAFKFSTAPPVYTDQAAAAVGGLTSGQMFQNPLGQLFYKQ